MPEAAEDEPLLHICEVCGAEKVMTPEEAFQEGWDYPPMMGIYGVVSARTCGNCPINRTLYWRLITHKGTEAYKLNDEERALVERIQNEPDSIRPPTNTQEE